MQSGRGHKSTVSRGFWYFAGQLLLLTLIAWLWRENQSSSREFSAVRIPDGATAESRDGVRPVTAVSRPPGAKAPSVKPGASRESAKGSDSASIFSVRHPEPKDSDRVEEPGPAGLPGAAATAAGAVPFSPGIRSVQSLLENGGFEEGLAPWACEEGKVVQDPEDSGNSVLEITPKAGQFQLQQGLRRSPVKKALRLSLRAKAEPARESFQGHLRVYLYDENGQLLMSTMAKSEASAKWETVSLNLGLKFSGEQKRRAASLGIENGYGGGKLWIDDVSLLETSGQQGSGVP